MKKLLCKLGFHVDKPVVKNVYTTSWTQLVFRLYPHCTRCGRYGWPTTFVKLKPELSAEQALRTIEEMQDIANFTRS